MMIRPAKEADLGRIAEIEVFNYRLNFYPIFRDDDFYFSEMTVVNRMDAFRNCLDELWVYDDGVVKAFMQVSGMQLKKLFIEPALQRQGLGALLLAYAISLGADHLWALEKNVRAIAFYLRHGFHPTGRRMPEEGTAEFLIELSL